MKCLVKEGRVGTFSTDAMLVPYFEGEEGPGEAGSLLPGPLQAMIQEIVDSGDFGGKRNQISLIYPRGASAAKRVILTGMGKRADADLDSIRCAYASAAQKAREANAKSCATYLEFGPLTFSGPDCIEAVVEGVFLGLYQFTPFKTLERDKIKDLKELVIVEQKKKKIPEMRKAVDGARKICDAVYFARDLVSTPGNELTPSDMAREAKTLAKKRKKVHVTVLELKELEELGMNALLGVAKGSCQPPRFIILEYRGGKRSMAPIVLIGKGLTFDSGGISIKPSEKMDQMKTDMAGGAAVMGVIMAAADLSLPINVAAMIPATENLPSGNAYKPGDVLKSLSGQTIEVVNTDAEGRLTLADALTYAARYKPSAIIDIATLTGACIVALGDHVIGMLGTDEKLKERMKQAAQSTGERVWELPLWEDYHEQIKSEVADFKNSGGRAAGTITAAAFLSKFAGDTPWLHLDIAGPAWLDKATPYIPRGASGVGVRLLLRYLRNMCSEKPQS